MNFSFEVSTLRKLASFWDEQSSNFTNLPFVKLKYLQKICSFYIILRFVDCTNTQTSIKKKLTRLQVAKDFLNKKTISVSVSPYHYLLPTAIFIIHNLLAYSVLLLPSYLLLE